MTKDEAALRARLSPEGMAAEPSLSAITRHPWFRPPDVRLHRRSTRDPACTVVLPVHNQERIVGRFLADHLATSVEPHDLVVVFDSCADQSRSAFWASLDALPNQRLCSVAEITTSVPYFETACDNLGFVVADTPVVIECQVDLIMGTHGYDRRLLRALQDERVSTASGRAGHSLRNVYAPPPGVSRETWAAEMKRGEVGLCGRLIETAGFDVADASDTAWFCETVNRGPLAFRRGDLQRLGYLDHENLFLGDDDHDFNFRAWRATGQLPAYVPMKVRSNLEEGSTRKPRDAANQEVFEKLRSRPDRSALRLHEQDYKPYCPPTEFRMPRR